MQEQMDNVSKEIETLRQNQSEILEIKNTVTEMKNVFGMLISNSDMAKERINKIENVLMVSAPNRNVKRQRNLKRNRISKTADDYKRYNIHIMRTPEGEQRERRRNIKTING